MRAFLHDILQRGLLGWQKHKRQFNYNTDKSAWDLTVNYLETPRRLINAVKNKYGTLLVQVLAIKKKNSMKTAVSQNKTKQNKKKHKDNKRLTVKKR